MRNVGKWLLYSVISIVAVLAVALWAGGAVNWNREPPYERVNAWGEKGDAPGQFSNPTGIAVTADAIFVADARNNRIQVLDKNGNFVRAFGSKILGRPMNLAIAGGRLYVPDYFKDVVHVFTLDGEHERAIEAEDGLESPGGVAVRADDTLLVADTYGQRIVHLAVSGKVLRSWSGEGSGAGEFSYPTDVAIAADGGFYMADGYNDRVQHFGPTGSSCASGAGHSASTFSAHSRDGLPLPARSPSGPTETSTSPISTTTESRSSRPTAFS